MMYGNNRKQWALLLIGGAALLQSGTCGSVLDTVRLAFDIVSVWV